MMDDLFADIPTVSKDKGEVGLFDDIPVAKKPAAPAPQAVTRPEDVKGMGGRTAAIPAPPPAISKDASGVRPSSRDVSDKWQPAGVGDYVKQRGRQFAQGATESIAAVPEGLEVMDRARRRAVKTSSEEVLPNLMKERDDLEAILAEMRPKAKEGDWEAGARVKAAETRLFQVNGQIQMASRMADEAGASLTVPIEKSAGFQVGAALREKQKSVIGAPDPNDDSFGGKVATGTGSIIPTIATTVAGAAIGAPELGLLAGGIQGSASQASSFYKDAIQGGASEEDAEKAARWGSVVGLTEVLPVGRMFEILPAPVRTKFANALIQRVVKIGENAGEEALQEYVQQVAQNLDAAGVLPGSSGYDPDRKWDENALENALVGAVVGGAVGGVAHGGGHTNPKVETGDTPPDATAALNGQTAPTAPSAAIPTDAAQAAATPPAENVAPDAAAALAQSKPPVQESAADIARRIMSAKQQAPVTPEGNAAPTAPAPTAPAGTPEPAGEAVSGPEAAGDTQETVPEAPATIASQNQALLDPKNKRKAVFIPNSSYEAGEVDEPAGKTIGRVVLPEGILFFNKAKGYTARDVTALYKSGRLGSVLGLGEFTKADVAKSAAKGSPEVAVTERTPEGVEVKAAAGTQETAPEQLAALEADKTPGNTVQTESPAKVMADRLAATQKPASQEPEVDPGRSRPDLLAEYAAKYDTAPAAQPAEQVAPEAKASPAAQALAALDAPKAASIKEVAQKRSEAPPKAVEAKEMSKARAEAKPEAKPETKAETKAEVTPPDNASKAVYGIAPTGEVARIETDPKTGKKTYIPATREEIKAQTAAYNQRIQDNLSAKDKAEENAKAEQRTEQREAKRETISEKMRKGEVKGAVAETEALIEAGDKKLTDDEKSELRQNAKIAEDLIAQVSDDFVAAETMNDKKATLARLNSIIEEANKRGFTWGRKGVGKYKAGAVTWLYDVRTFQRKLAANIGKVTYKELNTFLTDEVATKKGDARNMKDRRLEVGAAASKPSGTGATENVKDAKQEDDAKDAAIFVPEDEAYDPTESNDSTEGNEDDDISMSSTRRNDSVTEEVADFAAGDKVMWSAGGETTPATIAGPKKMRGDVAFYRINTDEGATEVRADTLKPVTAKGNVVPADGAGRRDAVDLDPMRFAVDKPRRLGDLANLFSRPAIVEGVLKRNAFFGKLHARVQEKLGKLLFDKLASAANDTQVIIVSDEAYSLLAVNGEKAYYDKGRDLIVVPETLASDPSTMAYYLTHEAAHAAFVHVMDDSPKITEQVETLLNIATEHAEMSGEVGLYGLRNADEFVAEAWSNPAFQEFLAGVPLTNEDVAALRAQGFTKASSTLKTLWDAVRAVVSKAFGIQEMFKAVGIPANTPTALDTIFEISDLMLRLSPEARLGTATGILAAQEPSTLKTRLSQRGLSDADAADIADMIEEEFGGTATDEELDAIAEEILRVTGDAKEAAKPAQAQAKQVQEAGKKLNERIAREVDEEFVPGKKPGRPWLLWGLTNSQIARVAERWFGTKDNPVRKLAELVERKRVARARYLKDMSRVVTGLVEAQKRHPRKVIEDFFSLAHDATMANVHPDVPLTDKRNAHLGKDALKGMWGKGRHPDLAARFDALPVDLKELYARTRDTLTDAQDRMTYGLMRNILNKAGFTDEVMIRRFHEDQATEQDFATVGEELAHHLVNATEMKKVQGPYFNLVRRGEYVVRGTYQVTAPGNAKVIESNVFEFKSRDEAIKWAKSLDLRPDIKSVWIDKNTGKTYFEDADGQVKVSSKDIDAKQVFRVTVQNQHVEFVNSRKEAKRLRDQLAKAGLKMDDIEVKRWERDAQNAEMLSDQFRSLVATMDKRGSTANLTPAQKAELKGLMNEVSLRFLGSTRIQSSRLPRRYVQGASKDLPHNTFDYAQEASGYLAKLDIQPKIEEAMEELEARVKALSSRGEGYGEGAREISNEISARVLDPDYAQMEGKLAAVVKRLTTLSFIDNLASIGYSIINSLGVATMSMPHLSGDFNPASASYQLIRAYYDIGAIRTGATGIKDTFKALGNVTATGENYLSDVQSRLKEKRERDMLGELSDIGLIDSEGGLDTERLVGAQEGIAKYIDVPLDYAQNLVRAMPQAVETINRTVTALAAYRMMYAKTEDHAKAVRYAADSVDMTQGNYAASNAAPIFNSMIGRVALQFKKYSQMTVYLLARNTRRAFMGGAPGERRKGIATMAYFLAGQQVMAGTLGLPIEPVKLLVMASHGLGLSDDDWEDFQKKVEEFYKWFTGSEKTAEALTYGVTRAIPMGWDFDLNSRVGMDNLITFGEPRSTKEADEKAFLFNLIAGAPGGTLYNMKSGIQDLMQGDIAKGLEKVIPFKTVADAIRAGREPNMSVQETVLKVMGLNPGRLAREGLENRREASTAQEAKDARNKLISRYIDARGPAQVAKVKSQIREYNAKLPKNDRNRISLNWIEEKRQEELAP